MKKLVIAAGIVAGIAGGAILFGIAHMYYINSAFRDATEDFFSAAKTGDREKARKYLSEDFNASTSKEKFDRFLESGAVGNFKEVSRMTEWRISGNRGTLKGTLISEKGGTIPMTIVFVMENGDWKIFSIQKPRAGIFANQWESDMPDRDSQIILVNKSMRAFALSVNEKDFTGYYGHIANVWRKQTTADKLREASQWFIDNKVNLLALEQYTPLFDESPSLSDNGVLSIRGHYDTRPHRVLFEFEFLLEGFDWKPVAARINLKTVEK